MSFDIEIKKESGRLSKTGAIGPLGPGLRALWKKRTVFIFCRFHLVPRSGRPERRICAWSNAGTPIGLPITRRCANRPRRSLKSSIPPMRKQRRRFWQGPKAKADGGWQSRLPSHRKGLRTAGMRIFTSSLGPAPFFPFSETIFQTGSNGFSHPSRRKARGGRNREKVGQNLPGLLTEKKK